MKFNVKVLSGAPKVVKDFFLYSKKKKVKLNMAQLGFIYFHMCRLAHEYYINHDGEESPLINSIIKALE